MNIARLLETHADRFPDRLALVERRGGTRHSISYAELHRLTATGAAFLRGRGLGIGDTVLFLHPVSNELYIAFLSVLRAGGTAVFVDPGQGRDSIESCLRNSPPDAVCGNGAIQFMRLLSPSLRSLTPRFYTPRSLLRAGSRKGKSHAKFSEDSAIPEDTPALVTFTSGGTGAPKAIVRSRRFFSAQHTALVGAIALEPGEIDLVTLPMFALAHLASGLTNVLANTNLAQPGAVNAAAVRHQLLDERIGRITASPAFFDSLLENAPGPFPNIAKIYTGGAPVSHALLEKMTRAFPNADVAAVYGCSEAEPIAVIHAHSISPEDSLGMRRGDGLLAGSPVPGIRVAVIEDRWGSPLGARSDAEFQSLLREPAQPGEIVVAGDHVLTGYRDGAGEAETRIQTPGATWLRTGDAGYFDSAGRLWLLGRCAAALPDHSGRRSYPFPIETPVNSMEGVRRSAALMHRGAPVLVVEPEHEAPPVGNLADSVLARVSDFPVSQVRLVDRIPVDKRHNAKIDYVALEALLD